MDSSMAELTLTARTHANAAVPAVPDRNAGLDALRATLTLLVLFHHTAITYGATGGWFYREVPTDGRLQTMLLTFFCAVNQAYFMGLFFLMAGYFTPAAVDKSGPLKYFRDRVLRLGIPLAVFGFVIGPATIALAQTAQGRPFLGTFSRLWARGEFENGPLWFVQALLIFAVGYLLWHGIASRFGGTDKSVRAFPSNSTIALAALITGVAAFALRLIWPTGSNAFGLQLGYFASYVVLFIAGCIGWSGKWLENIPETQKRLWWRISTIAMPVLPAVVLLAPDFPELKGDPAGRWNVEAAVYAFWEPLVAWGLIMVLLATFHRVFARLNSVWAMLSRRAYAIYIIHPPVLVGIALAWRTIEAPHLVKFAITGTLTCLVCFVIAGLLLRVPQIRRIV
jgi:fucose 4-O-acetylase-like acetyltransferase